MGGKRGRNNLKFSLSSSYDEHDYYIDGEIKLKKLIKNSPYSQKKKKAKK